MGGRRKLRWSVRWRQITRLRRPGQRRCRGIRKCLRGGWPSRVVRLHRCGRRLDRNRRGGLCLRRFDRNLRLDPRLSRLGRNLTLDPRLSRFGRNLRLDPRLSRLGRNLRLDPRLSWLGRNLRLDLRPQDQKRVLRRLPAWKRHARLRRPVRNPIPLLLRILPRAVVRKNGPEVRRF